MDNILDTDVIDLMLQDFGRVGDVTVRPICDVAELREVYRLTYGCYVASGYSAPHPCGLVIHHPYIDLLSETTILVALMDGKIVGSITLTEDNPQGISVDDDFKKECDELRGQGGKLGCIWRLVTIQSTRSQRGIVLSLMRAMITLMLKKQIKNTVMVVNPKHESVYNRMLNAKTLATHESTPGLSNAAAVLLRFNPGELPAGSVVSPKIPMPGIADLIIRGDY